MRDRQGRTRGRAPGGRRLAGLTAVLTVVFAVTADLEAQETRVQVVPADSRISPAVRAEARNLGAGERLPVIIEFEASEALTPPRADETPPASGRTRLERTSALRARVEPVVADFSAALAGDDLRVTDRFWLAPAVAAEVSAVGLERLASLPSVRRVLSDAPLPVALEPARSAGAPPSYTSDAMRTIGADVVWDDGATGEGVVIAFFDSGVDAENAMVASRWRGRRTELRASWFDPFLWASEPEDRIGHGTQVALAAVGALPPGGTLELADGTSIVATSGIDVVTGPAPEAEWIAARIFENFAGVVFTRRSVLLQAFQWALDPDGNPATDDAPDIINNSWGILPTGDFDLCDDVLYEAIDADEAAGIAVLFSAGNAGPAAGSIAFPGARDDPQLRSFAVGGSSGTTNIDVASFSGRGPSPCDGGIRPDIIAPSTVPEVRADGAGRVRLTGFTVQGTSYSVAQVSGALALLRQARPGATPEQLKRFLLDTAEDVGPAGPDNAAGSGLLDVPAALSAAGVSLGGRLVQIAAAAVDTEGLSLTLRNRGGASWEGGELRVSPHRISSASSSSSTIDATVSARLPDLEAGEAVAAFLAWPGGQAPPDLVRGIAFRVEVLDASGEAILSRPMLVAPPDGFGGFVLTAGDLAAGANDFGRLGRIAAPQGFAWRGADLLPAGGLAVVAGDRVSDAFYATTLGRFDVKRFGPAVDTDWAPRRGLTVSEDAEAAVRFDDLEALRPIGIEVAGRYEASDVGDAGALTAVYTVRNLGASAVQDLVVGLLADWDLPGGETIRWDPDLEALVAEPRDGGGAPTITVLAADRPVLARVELPLGTPGTGSFYVEDSGILADSLVDPVKADLLRGGPVAGLPGAGTAEDNAALLATGPLVLAPGGSATLRFWLLAAPDAASAGERLAALRAEDLPPPPGTGDSFAALPPFPNPFRPGTGVVRFPFTVPEGATGEVALEVYDLAGRLVYRETAAAVAGSAPELAWDGRLAEGREAASGMYLYVIRLGDETVSGRLLLAR